MRGAADGGGFFGRDAAETEVVQLEGKKRRIAGANQRFADDLLDRARERGHGDGIPHLDEKRFSPVGEPEKFRIGVFDGDEGVVRFDDRAFLDRADAEWKAAAVFGVERFEAFVVEGFRMAGEVRVSDAAGFFDVVEREDLARETGFDDVLQHGEHGFFKHAAARFEIGIDVARVRRILPPVRELVRVRVEDGIQPKRLHAAPWGCGYGWVWGRGPITVVSIAEKGIRLIFTPHAEPLILVLRKEHSQEWLCHKNLRDKLRKEGRRCLQRWTRANPQAWKRGRRRQDFPQCRSGYD